MLIITPPPSWAGRSNSIEMLPPLWRKVTLFNPVVYLIDGFRWAFFGTADVGVFWSLAATCGFLAVMRGGGGLDVPHRLPTQELICAIACAASVVGMQAGVVVVDLAGDHQLVGLVRSMMACSCWRTFSGPPMALQLSTSSQHAAGLGRQDLP